MAALSRERIVACMHARKTKELLNYIRLVGKLQNSFLAILTLISRNHSKEEEMVKNAVFFSLLAGRHQRVKRLLYMEDTGTSKVQGYFPIVVNMPMSYVYTSFCRMLYSVMPL